MKFFDLELGGLGAADAVFGARNANNDCTLMQFRYTKDNDDCFSVPEGSHTQTGPVIVVFTTVGDKNCKPAQGIRRR
jgi:hypothetical protein